MQHTVFDKAHDGDGRDRFRHGRDRHHRVSSDWRVSIDWTSGPATFHPGGACMQRPARMRQCDCCSRFVCGSNGALQDVVDICLETGISATIGARHVAATARAENTADALRNARRLCSAVVAFLMAFLHAMNTSSDRHHDHDSDGPGLGERASARTPRNVLAVRSGPRCLGAPPVFGPFKYRSDTDHIPTLRFHRFDEQSCRKSIDDLVLRKLVIGADPTPALLSDAKGKGAIPVWSGWRHAAL
jgi:hypothetical protein